MVLKCWYKKICPKNKVFVQFFFHLVQKCFLVSYLFFLSEENFPSNQKQTKKFLLKVCKRIFDMIKKHFKYTWPNFLLNLANWESFPSLMYGLDARFEDLSKFHNKSNILHGHHMKNFICYKYLFGLFQVQLPESTFM